MNIKSSGNKKTNKPDIKPLRSEVFSNFKRNNVGGGLLMIYLIGTINLIGVILLATWFFNTSGNQQETGQGLIQRLSILEEKMENQININKELVSSLDEDVEFINKEIRKLWDLSNKKNRRNIQIQTSQIKDLSIEIEKFKKEVNSLSAKYRALNLELAKSDKLKLKIVNRLDKLEGSSLGSVEERITSQEEAIISFDAYRLQVNKTLISIQERVSFLMNKFEELE